MHNKMRFCLRICILRTLGAGGAVAGLENNDALVRHQNLLAQDTVKMAQEMQRQQIQKIQALDLSEELKEHTLARAKTQIAQAVLDRQYRFDTHDTTKPRDQFTSQRTFLEYTKDCAHATLVTQVDKVLAKDCSAEEKMAEIAEHKQSMDTVLKQYNAKKERLQARGDVSPLPHQEKFGDVMREMWVNGIAGVLSTQFAHFSATEKLELLEKKRAHNRALFFKQVPISPESGYLEDKA